METLLSGRLNNFRVNISCNTVSIKQGSFTKYVLGNNLSMLTRGDIERGFEKMSDELHLQLQKQR